jgi:hypothetical protein
MIVLTGLKAHMGYLTNYLIAGVTLVTHRMTHYAGSKMGFLLK